MNQREAIRQTSLNSAFLPPTLNYSPSTVIKTIPGSPLLMFSYLILGLRLLFQISTSSTQLARSITIAASEFFAARILRMPCRARLARIQNDIVHHVT